MKVMALHGSNITPGRGVEAEETRLTDVATTNDTSLGPTLSTIV